MTRKDYVAIAAAFKRARDVAETNSADYIAGWLEGLDEGALMIAQGMVADNPRYDRARFLAACGVQS